MILFTDPCSKVEHELKPVGSIWGGVNGETFLNAVDKYGSEGTYCVDQLRIPFLDHYTLIRNIEKALRNV